MIEHKLDEVDIKYQPIFEILSINDENGKYTVTKIERMINTVLRWIKQDKKLLQKKSK